MPGLVLANTAQNAGHALVMLWLLTRLLGGVGGAGLLVKDACEGTDHPVDGPNPLERGVEHLDRAGLAGAVESGKGASPQLPELGHRFRRIVGTAS